MVKAHLIQHTHWDREWYFTNEDAIVLSDQVFTEVLDELERNPKVNFCLDGQTSIVDEYVEINPESLPRIQKLIEAGRLFVGPWYAQTDALLVDAESILRNLIIGISDTLNKYGKPMMVGYLPDTFGFNANLPTLLQQANIDNFMCWRGLNFETMVPSPYFIWKGLGDKLVYAMNFPFGYMTGMMNLDAIADVPKFVTEKLDVAVEMLHNHGDNEDILVPSGVDQKSMVLNFDQIISEINASSKYDNLISDYPSYVEIMRNNRNLPEYKGELRQPVYARVHRSIGSVRTQMKLNNFNLEQKILKRIEPLMVIAEKNGVRISKGLLRRLWKLVLQNQAHDSIGGCVSDNVMLDINHRIKQANEIADGIENLIFKRIADALSLKANQVLLFNTTPTDYRGPKTVHIVASSKAIQFKGSAYNVIENEKYYPERKNAYRMTAIGYEYFDEPAYYELDVKIEAQIPALGYTIVEFNDSQNELEIPKHTERTVIGNPDFQLSYEAGTVSLKANGIEYQDFIQLVDSANDGDTYDYSPLEGDKAVRLNFEHAKSFSDTVQESLVIYGNAILPKNLEDRLASQPNQEKINYQMTLSIDSQNVIEGKIILENKIYSHRLRLVINVLDSSEKSIAQIQNGFVENLPIPVPADWQEKMVERPVNLEIFDKSISVVNDNDYLTVFADGLKEYQRIKNKLYITLMATTGELGKPNLKWRPGRASGDTTNEGHIMMQTPLAQEIGQCDFTFGIAISKGKFDEFKVAQQAENRLQQSISYQKQSLNVFINRLDNKIWPLQEKLTIPEEFSLLELPENLIISAIYPSYFHDTGFVIRFANPTGKEQLMPEAVLKLGTVVNAVEEVQNQISILPYDYLSILIAK
ncbi:MULTISPECIES: alpha-mannosidase [unclassified Enterococcus]|uniref:glycoside hydrolase family 38 N-terminal domain-containing protein n=1 Tax=unclassified Enterococcus TaxID=2608891 RepID=UPI0015537F77|nr:MULTISPECIES: alpha-mannosidase [unclassified Enterococcus]MBS7576708.1 alpha-mannosidase [Enterococcus sp. MMGLQ5-2]MBS7583805.1 alpha-mannosidase [Enterococcus sp. MMGLQ5-1]NPD11666.1 alpha-mannosidase [Enterococcus sp. MMGLQ5-1]NPD36545.1 alpha-mannosidase [Enterococcus sp. MMGLQ5-2]